MFNAPGNGGSDPEKLLVDAFSVVSAGMASRNAGKEPLRPLLSKVRLSSLLKVAQAAGTDPVKKLEDTFRLRRPAAPAMQGKYGPMTKQSKPGRVQAL